MTETRGELNHNPLNLNWIAPQHAFHGQVGIEIVPAGKTYKPRFGRYDTDFNGIRASAEQLYIDNTRHGLKTITRLVGDPVFGWAPAADRNDVAAYVKTVCTHLAGYLMEAVDPDAPIDLSIPHMLVGIWPGFCIEENGRCNYPTDLITAACYSALGIGAKSTSPKL